MQCPQKLLITGAGGFIGKSLLGSFEAGRFDVHALVRRSDPTIRVRATEHLVEDLAICRLEDLADAMDSADCLVHLAAVVPGKGAISAENMTSGIARTVAAAAAVAKIRRVIVISSVYAELAEQGHPRARLYGQEKLMADRIFGELLPEANIIFLRPPVVYGVGMTGSLLALTKMVSKRMWLPLALANHKRSYVSLTNLVDLILTLIRADEHRWQAARGSKYVPTDGEPASTVDLLHAISAGVDVPVRTFPVPLWMLRLAGVLSGKTEMISGAIDPLLMNDNDALFRDFGWVPKEKFPESYINWSKQVLNLL